MQWRKRSDLKPGEMFAVECGAYGRGYRCDDVMVVLDDKTEVGFWRGGKSVYGDIAPSVLVLVVS